MVTYYPDVLLSWLRQLPSCLASHVSCKLAYHEYLSTLMLDEKTVLSGCLSGLHMNLKDVIKLATMSVKLPSVTYEVTFSELFFLGNFGVTERHFLYYSRQLPARLVYHGHYHPDGLLSWLR